MGMSAQAAGPTHPREPTAAVKERTSAARGGITNLLTGLLANEWAIAGLIFAVTRAIALLGAYSGAKEITAVETFRNKGWLAELALNWDAAWYAGIALDGYYW